MKLRYRGLAPTQFRELYDLPDEVLADRNIRRMVVDEKPGFPCRVTLDDAEVGESVLLLPYEHHAAASPYRASGPIFVREGNHTPFDRLEPPPVFAGRALSARAYDGDGLMVDADIAEGQNMVPLLERLFARTDTDYVHVHYARRGCFACRVERG